LRPLPFRKEFENLSDIPSTDCDRKALVEFQTPSYDARRYGGCYPLKLCVNATAIVTPIYEVEQGRIKEWGWITPSPVIHSFELRFFESGFRGSRPNTVRPQS